MVGTKSLSERERTAKLIAKTRASIHKKHTALKTGIMEKEIVLEKQLKPIIEPLKQIVGNTASEDKPVETTFMKSKRKNKREYSDDEEDDNNDGDDNAIPTQITPQRLPWNERINKKRSNVMSDSSIIHSTPIESQQQQVTPFDSQDEEVFETGDNPSLETSVRQALNIPQGRQRLQSQLGLLGQVYVNTLLIGNARNEIDLVYGVYFDQNGTMLGNKKFDVDTDDIIIIDGERYKGTLGLYELIFKKIPNDAIYTENDKQTYKHILLTTNAHRRDNNARMPIKSNKGHKYKNIIAPLLVTRSVSGTSIGSGIKTNIPSAVRLTDNEIDYVHWDDPNELVDRLQLLDASRRAGNNAHDNEILSIIEELRETGLIIN
ncbi:hypothetical protein ALC57_14496 [Trachymyrmex cornetzi]|uniref:DUF8207 domain-containing protein n=1 Tax=Trachymyrmex cornetzi TaxID=471704 RepID=A0A151IYD8_9HYME|nr:hypothetical protein ALC57_14496 [Trachymyrmex cornetzi]